MRAGINDHFVQQLEIDHQMSVFSANPMRAITMAPGFSVDFHFMLTPASDCGLYV
jgi:hypothetical protein